jgi:hypothetical protein
MNDISSEIERQLAGIAPDQRRRVAIGLAEQNKRELLKHQALKVRLEVKIAAAEVAKQWFEASDRFVLEKNEHTRLHHFLEAAKNNNVVDAQDPDVEIGAMSEDGGLMHTFVVKHDWARAFENAEGMGDAVKLPYPICAFELRFNGRNVIALVWELDGEQTFSAFVQVGEVWIAVAAERGRMQFPEDKIAAASWSQIRAICVALDAEVATHEVIRAPHKLNEKRVKEGKIPLYDYHAVDLAHRQIISNPAESPSNGSKKRLHFRRGHWRHYQASKTWIKWCLVGDPDLGFIGKHYTL